MFFKDKDCSTLEKSSLIPFSYWKSTVALLTSDKESSETAIVHYMKNKQVKCFTRKYLVIRNDQFDNISRE